MPDKQHKGASNYEMQAKNKFFINTACYETTTNKKL